MIKSTITMIWWLQQKCNVWNEIESRVLYEHMYIDYSINRRACILKANLPNFEASPATASV